MKIPKTAAILALAMGAIFTLVVPGRVAAQTAPVIVFTEESDTLLTATVGGNPFGTVTFNSLDHWTWVVPSDRPNASGTSANNSQEYWSEPGAPIFGNTIDTVFVNLRSALLIQSDVVPPFFPSFPRQDGYTSLNKFRFDYVGGTSETFSVQFFDHGDLATVPDTASTLGLFLFSTASLLIIPRLRCFRRG